MKILKKQGAYQVEDWSEEWDVETYPNLKQKQYVVGCYPKANMLYPYWYRKETRVRVGIDFETLEEAIECFEHLLNGSKSIPDYKERVSNPKALAWIEK